MKKVLFIASHRMDRAPGQRFRFEQYFDYLKQNGFQCELSYLLTEEDDKVFYSPGHYLKKVQIILKNIAKRRRDLARINQYDIVFIFREALMTRSTYFERKMAHSKVKTIFDFDDAIWLNDTSAANQLFSWLKNPSKIKENLALVDLVFAGNAYLKRFAEQFNKNVVLVPTTIDTNAYLPKTTATKDVVTIGWSGSITTIKHFELALPALLAIKRKYDQRVRFLVIGDSAYRNEELQITGRAWQKSTEIQDLSEIDIGIMPLPDDEWANGKCGLKGLQYMALEIATIMSPVGVNTEIIQDGINGFLAADTKDWIEKLEHLINDSELRVRLGKAARQTVVNSYSIESTKHLYLEWFKKLSS